MNFDEVTYALQNVALLDRPEVLSLIELHERVATSNEKEKLDNLKKLFSEVHKKYSKVASSTNQVKPKESASKDTRKSKNESNNQPDCSSS